MTFLARLVRQLRWHSRLPELAEEIVDRVFEDVWRRVGERVMRMSSAESRGYTRVLACSALRRQADLSLMWLQLPPQWQPRLVTLATEHIVARVAQRAQTASHNAPRWRRAA